MDEADMTRHAPTRSNRKNVNFTALLAPQRAPEWALCGNVECAC